VGASRLLLSALDAGAAENRGHLEILSSRAPRLVNSFKMRLAENRSVHAQHNWKKGAAQAFTANKVMKAMALSSLTSKMQQAPRPADVDETALPAQAVAGTDVPQYNGNGAADKPPSEKAYDDSTPAPGEEVGADCPNIGMRRTRAGKAPTHDEMKQVAMRVESACQVLVTGHRKMKKRMEALSSRVVSLAEGQAFLADSIGTVLPPRHPVIAHSDSGTFVSASAEPSALVGPSEEGSARAARFAAVEASLAPDVESPEQTKTSPATDYHTSRQDMYTDRILAPLMDAPEFTTSAVIDEDPLDENSIFSAPTKSKNGTTRSFAKKRPRTPVSRTSALWEDSTTNLNS